MMNVKINGNPNDLFKNDFKEFTFAVEREMATSAKQIEASAKRAIVTLGVYNNGGLRKSIKSFKTGMMRHVIGTELNYAELNEKGARMTRAELARHLEKISGPPPTQNKGVLRFIGGGQVLWKARPYLEPALKEEVQHLARRIKRIMP